MALLFSLNDDVAIRTGIGVARAGKMPMTDGTRPIAQTDHAFRGYPRNLSRSLRCFSGKGLAPRSRLEQPTGPAQCDNCARAAPR
jgi:hypothetical protein